MIVFLYTVLRAYLVPFAHDESYTYLNAVAKPVGQVLGLAFKDANNHPLNTWGMYFASEALGPREWVLRLPNLVAHLAYLVAAWLMVRRMLSRPVRLLTFVVLATNPFALEFFGLARGYGIGLGLLMTAMWLGAETLQTTTEPRSFLFGCASIVAAALACFANYSYVYFYLASCLFLMAVRWRVEGASIAGSPEPRRPQWATAAVAGFFLWTSFLLVMSVGREIAILRAGEEFYVGGQTGPWHDTARSLIHASLQGLPFLEAPAEVGVALILAASVLVVVKALLPRGADAPGRVTRYAALAFLGAGAAMTAVSSGLKVNYLEGRSALQFFPLVVVTAGFLADDLGRRQQAHPVAHILAWVLGIAAALNLVLAADLHSVSLWPYDADSKQMLMDLSGDIVRSGLRTPVRLGVNWWFEPTVNFYRVTQSLAWLEPVTRDGLEGAYDYYYFEPGSRDAVHSCAIQVIRVYPRTGNTLAVCPP